MNLSKKIGKKGPVDKKTGSLWKGPQVSGVTQSMLGAFLGCRERFRIKYVLGLRPNVGFEHKIEYGNMWHLCEESYHNGENWQEALRQYASKLVKEYQGNRTVVDKWFRLCLAQFELYLRYWKDYTEDKTSVFQEYEFDEELTLSSGKVVRLRGKMDGILMDGKGKLWLYENKTKGDIDQIRLTQQLDYDLQIMFYLVALTRMAMEGRPKELKGHKIGGVLYNVIRRPVSGGKYTVVQHKGTKNKPPESLAQYIERVKGLMEGDPHHFFMRWDVITTLSEVTSFVQNTLSPILEQLWDWWEYIDSGCEGVNTVHYRYPFGVKNSLADGGVTDLDNFLLTGQLTGLRKTDRLFPELSDDS